MPADPANFRRKRYAEIQRLTICGYLRYLRENKKKVVFGGGSIKNHTLKMKFEFCI